MKTKPILYYKIGLSLLYDDRFLIARKLLQINHDASVKHKNGTCTEQSCFFV